MNRYQRKQMFGLGLLLLVGCTVAFSINFMFHGVDNASASSESAPEVMLAQLAIADFAVARNESELVRQVKELSNAPFEERVLVVSQSAIYESRSGIMTEAISLGILIVAVDVPISKLYDAAAGITFDEPQAMVKSIPQDLSDLPRSGNDNVVVVSMLQVYDPLPSSDGYGVFTNYYANPDHVVLTIRSLAQDIADEVKRFSQR